MTFKVGKNDVHIGFWEAFSIISSVVICTWGVSEWNNFRNNREEKRIEEQHVMYQKINWIAKQDTLLIGYKNRQDSILTVITRKQAVFENVFIKGSKEKLQYVTEQYDQNGLHFNVVK